MFSNCRSTSSKIFQALSRVRVLGLLLFLLARRFMHSSFFPLNAYICFSIPLAIRVFCCARLLTSSVKVLLFVIVVPNQLNCIICSNFTVMLTPTYRNEIDTYG